MIRDPKLQAVIDRLAAVRQRGGPATSTPGGTDAIVKVYGEMADLRKRANTVLLGDE